MINLRNIFNPNYYFIGILLITIITILLIIINSNKKEIFNKLGKTYIISGIISLIIDLTIYLMTKVIPDKYKIFITIISNNIIKNIGYISITTITIGIIFIIISKIFNEERSD